MRFKQTPEPDRCVWIKSGIDLAAIDISLSADLFSDFTLPASAADSNRQRSGVFASVGPSRVFSR